MSNVIKIKSGSPYEEKESYSRAVVVDNWIFVSNTAGVNYKTQKMSADPVEQATECLNKIDNALKSVGSSLADVVMSTVYIPDPSDAPSVMAYVGQRFKGIDPARTVLCPSLGGVEYKVEIEVQAYRGIGDREVERKVISL
jgi:enamine deaminase RidA (YjgF/YER057c/UK114 family)